MISWQEVFEETCPRFKEQLDQLRSLYNEDLGREWFHRKEMVFLGFGQIDMAYQSFETLERDLLRHAMWKIHFMKTADSSQLTLEAMRATVSQIFAIVSTKLASAFEQFYNTMLEVQNLLKYRSTVKA